MPVLALQAQREVAVDEVGLLQAHAQPPIEPRVAPSHLRRARAAEEIDVAPVGFDTGALLGPVAEAEIHLAVLAFGHGDARGNLGGLFRFLANRLDVGELEDLERVEPALALEQLALAEQVAAAVRQLPPDDLIADARVALNLERAVIGDGPWFGGELQHALPLGRARLFGEPNRRVRIAVVFQLIERRFAGGLDQRTIEGLPRLQRQPRHQAPEVVGRQTLETLEIDALGNERLALRRCSARCY